MKTILLIEDDVVLRENTKELLELSDYTVTAASNGKLGLQTAIATRPDIIVCDIMMPELDGYGVLEGLTKQEHTMHIPFIFLSAKTERQDVRKGMDLGADDYITKPFSEDEIISAIESRLAKAAILKDRRNTPNKEENTTDELRSLNDLKNFFDDNGEVFHFGKDETVYTEGKNSNYIYLVTKGIVKCHKLDEKGKELITALHKEDDLFGYTSFTQNIPYQETATTISEASLVGLSKNELTTILNTNHKLTLELIQLLTDDISGVKNQLLEMAYSSVYKKTATTILKFADKLNCKPNEAIKISRSDLASVAGIATETLIRTISSFKKQGLIVIEGRNIKIIDIEGLKDVC